MTGEQSAALRAAYLAGDTTPEMVEATGVDADEIETYLTWWCSRGCPEPPGE